MKNCFEIMKKRGFYKQSTNDENVAKLLDRENIVFYIGYDPTNIALHVGHLVPIMAMAHLQKMGHTPIVVLGGGTAMVGDPSGKTEARKLLSVEEIDHNFALFKKQMECFLILDGKRGYIVNNGDWLRNLNYLEFLRDIGKNFSVNRMLTFETYKEKLKHGLSFLEFNYILLQSYDFLSLYKRYHCLLQIGGDDQWANMVSGVDLIRRMEQSEEVECLTLPLILTSDGKKMGKTEKGATFLSRESTSVYDFYQYWVNVTDDDTIRFLKQFTFLNLEEISKYEHLKAEKLREAKQLLAFEVTKIVHGEEEAIKARDGAKAAFGSGGNLDLMPTIEIQKERLEKGINVVELFYEVKLCDSKSEVRRLIKQGGLKINDNKINEEALLVNSDFITGKGIILKSGKKNIIRVIVV